MIVASWYSKLNINEIICIPLIFALSDFAAFFQGIKMRFTQVFFRNKLQFKYWKRWVEREMHGDQVGILLKIRPCRQKFTFFTKEDKIHQVK